MPRTYGDQICFEIVDIERSENCFAKWWASETLGAKIRNKPVEVYDPDIIFASIGSALSISPAIPIWYQKAFTTFRDWKGVTVKDILDQEKTNEDIH